MLTRRIVNNQDVAYFSAYGSTEQFAESNGYLTKSSLTATVDGKPYQPFTCVSYCTSFTTINFNNDDGLVESYNLPAGSYQFSGTLADPVTELELIANTAVYVYVTFERVADTKKVASSFAENKQAVRESLQQRLSVIKHELWFDDQFGLPLVDKPSKLDIDFDVIDIVNQTEGVFEIIKFQSSVSGRNYSAEITVSTIYGEITVQV